MNKKIPSPIDLALKDVVIMKKTSSENDSKPQDYLQGLMKKDLVKIWLYTPMKSIEGLVNHELNKEEPMNDLALELIRIMVMLQSACIELEGVKYVESNFKQTRNGNCNSIHIAYDDSDRLAKCMSCETLSKSYSKLPHFSVGIKQDSYYCGCHGWD